MELGGICLLPALHPKEGVGVLFSLWREGRISRGHAFSFLSAPKVRSKPSPFPITSTASHSGSTGPQRLWPLVAVIQKHKRCLLSWLVPARGLLWTHCELLPSVFQSSWHFSKFSQVSLNLPASSRYRHKRCVSVYNSVCVSVWFFQPLSCLCISEWAFVDVYVYVGVLAMICLTYDRKI